MSRGQCWFWINWCAVFMVQDAYLGDSFWAIVMAILGAIWTTKLKTIE